ncbi:hypothetical protein EJB05_50793 [Eragrostis curvula]|uniref:Uncharacterized protein n=1 Tax=Eragrostis curvula TaxID=38414 RepID=A0A5J9SX76_9POAL|nr:hypothetical protein EJB05_50793 [Eragrostis curvula]
MQAMADDQGRITRMKTKLNREILSNQFMIAVLNWFDVLANLLSFMGISHSKLGKLGDCLERAGSPPSELDEIISICNRHLTNLVRTFNSCREHVSEFRRMLVEIKTAASVEKDAAAEEEDAEHKEKYAATDAVEDNDPAAEEKDADADAAEDTDPAAKEKDAAADTAEDNDPAVEEKDADADAAEDNDPADAARRRRTDAADDSFLWSERWLRDWEMILDRMADPSNVPCKSLRRNKTRLGWAGVSSHSLILLISA